MENKYEKQSVDRFIFLKDVQLLSMKNNNIETIGQLANQTGTNLRNIGFETNEIDEINFELNRLGLGLKN